VTAHRRGRRNGDDLDGRLLAKPLKHPTPPGVVGLCLTRLARADPHLKSSFLAVRRRRSGAAILGGESTIRLADLERDGGMDVIATNQGTLDQRILTPCRVRLRLAAPLALA
jgi:hypothetical protein